MAWRFACVRQLLSDVLFIFIAEKSCPHRYGLPNTLSLWAACRWSWGIISGVKRGNCAAPTESFFALRLSLLWRSSISEYSCLFHINHWPIAERIKLSFLGLKVRNSVCELDAQYAHFFRKMCNWKHSGIDLVRHRHGKTGNSDSCTNTYVCLYSAVLGYILYQQPHQLHIKGKQIFQLH